MVRTYVRKTEDRWSKEQLREALVEIKASRINVKDAVQKYGIPKATLYRYLNKDDLGDDGNISLEQIRAPGNRQILTKKEEDVLACFVKSFRQRGQQVGRAVIKGAMFDYCKNKKIPISKGFNQEQGEASDDWYYGFLNRHPDLKVTRSRVVRRRVRRH